MQAKTKRKRISQPTRRGAIQGAKGRSVECGPGAGRKGIATSFLARFHSLTIKPIKGVDVVSMLQGTSVARQLFECYAQYYWLVNNDRPVFSGETIDDVFKKFKLLIDGAELNIDSDDSGQHYFVIYQEAPSAWGWFIIEIKELLFLLKQTNVRLHDLFVQFIKSFCTSTCIHFWFEEGMNYAVDWLEENINQVVDEEGDDDGNIIGYEEYIDCLEEYKTGAAAEYEKLIRNTAYVEPNEMRDRIIAANIDSALIEMMCKGCDIAAEPFSVHMFDYNPMLEADPDDYDERLQFFSSFNVIWKSTDSVTEQYTQYLDDNAGQVGVAEAISWRIVKPDCNKLFSLSDWPMRLQKYMRYADGIIDRLTLKQDEPNDAALTE